MFAICVLNSSCRNQTLRDRISEGKIILSSIREKKIFFPTAAYQTLQKLIEEGRIPVTHHYSLWEKFSNEYLIIEGCEQS